MVVAANEEISSAAGRAMRETLLAQSLSADDDPELRQPVRRSQRVLFAATVNTSTDDGQTTRDDNYAQTVLWTRIID